MQLIYNFNINLKGNVVFRKQKSNRSKFSALRFSAYKIKSFYYYRELSNAEMVIIFQIKKQNRGGNLLRKSIEMSGRF